MKWREEEEKEGKGREGPHRSLILGMGESQRTSWKIKRQQPEIQLREGEPHLKSQG